MKKLYGLFFLVIAILIVVNIFFYNNIYQQQINYQKNILLKQTQICGWEIERNASDFQNEFQRILFSKNIDQFFIDEETRTNTTQQFEVLFSRFNSLIASIQILDNNNNVFSLVKDKRNVLLTDQYLSRTQKPLQEKELFEKNNGEWTYTTPCFSGKNQVTTNIIITFDINFFVKAIFKNYHIEDSQWQLLLEPDGRISMHNHSSQNIVLTRLELINENLSRGIEGSLLQAVIVDETKEKYLTAFYPVSFYSEEFGILFSIKTDKVFSTVLINIIFLATATFIILVIILFIFIAFLQKKRQEEVNLKKSEGTLRKIMETLPIGIFFISQDKKILSVNKTALEILKISDEKIILGKESTSLFFHFKEIPSLLKANNEETNLFIYYDEDDSEVLLFKKEMPLEVEGQDIILETFIDITPLENARKAEVAANNAKSEFLSKISQDIRTPLNGILSMSESLCQEKSMDENQKDKIEIIRKSAELLVSVINDLVDFSRIEAGKVLIEETRFSLQSEIELVIDSFAAMSEEKNIPIFTEIEDDFPEEIIGDPFILRQILTNLISNSLKYSQGEKVLISSGISEQKDECITVKITIQDDGKGVSANIKDIIKNNTYAECSEKQHGCEGLLKSKKLVDILKGELNIESPSLISSANKPGTLVSFTIQAFSNKSPEKNIDFSHILQYSDIKVLIFNDPKKKETSLAKVLKDFEIKSEITQFNDSSIPLLKARASDKQDNYSMIVIMDTPGQNGFTIAREIFINDLSDKFLILMISSNTKSGNLVKSKRMGVDYYLLYPYESSEIFDFIQTNFQNIDIPVSKPFHLKKIRQDISILVAEDNAINQKVAQIIFKNLGFEIEIAANGQKAVSMVRENKYDIIFMDLRMPVKTGFDATYEIRKLDYSMPIIALTANVSESDRTKAREVGMNDFLSKPVRADNIKNILIKWFSEPV